MAANSLVYPDGWGLNDMCSSAQGQALQVQAARSVNRTNTFSGTRVLPLAIIYTGASDFGLTAAGLVTQGAVLGLWNRIELIGLPNGHVMNWASLWLKPASLARGGQPAGMPTLKLMKQEATIAGTVTTLATEAYPWASEAAYESGQELRATPAAETIDLDSYDYFLMFQGENGANAELGLEIHAVTVNVTIDTSYGGQDLTMWRKS